VLPIDFYQQIIAEAEIVKHIAKEKPVSSNLFYCELIENRIHVRRDDGLVL